MMFRRLPLLVAALALVGAVGSASAASPAVVGMRMFDDDERTRVVFDLSAPVEYNLFALHAPERAVLDLRDVRLEVSPEKQLGKNRRISRIRHSSRGGAIHRVVFDLVQEVPTHGFTLAPKAPHGHRLVIDFGAPPPEVVPALRDVVVAIDAGHGGHDPGAIGRRHRTREKDVTLAIARKLRDELAKRKGIRPLLVRDRDYYLALRERTAIALRHGADLFLSIHADAFHKTSVSGASVYVLSTRGASSEAARWLADNENAADDTSTGLDLGEREPMVQSALVDMAQTGAIQLSSIAADTLLREMRKSVRVHAKHVHRAGFVVLKTRNVPSVLIETAFLSNRGDERLLRTSDYQWKIARALARGVEAYFRRQAPVGTWFASLAQAR